MSRPDVVRKLVVVGVLGVVLGGCGGDGAGTSQPSPNASSPSPAASSASPTTATSSASPTTTTTTAMAVPPDALRLTFETGGGCYDTAEPSGCGEQPYGTVDDDDVRALLHEAAPRLAAVAPGPNGCGDEFVDGVSVRVHVERRVTDVVERLEVCLSAVPSDDEAGAVLWRLYEAARDVTP